MWTVLALAGASEARESFGAVRAVFGGGVGQGMALRVGVAGDGWTSPHLGVGGRLTWGLDAAFFGRTYSVWTLEPVITVATAGGLRAVGQVGLGASAIHDLTYGGSQDNRTLALAVEPTASVAAGIAWRYSGSAILVRVDGNPHGFASALMLFEVGAPLHRR